MTTLVSMLTNTKENEVSPFYRLLTIANVEQVVRADISQSVEDAAFDPGVVIFQLGKQVSDLDSFLVVSGKMARWLVNRQLLQPAVSDDFLFIQVSQGSDQGQGAVEQALVGNHGAEVAAIKQVEQRRLDDVVAMMAKSNFIDLFFPGPFK